MISRIIEVCARNRFLVFTAVLLLTLAGIWSLQHVPLDALPDISDVHVIVHTTWAGEPPDVIEDQVTYPIVTSMLAAPHEKRIASGQAQTNADIEAAAIEGAVLRLRPKLMTVCAMLASLIPILWESGIGSDVMKPIAAPIVGGMITSTINVLIVVPVFFVMLKERALKRGTLKPSQPETEI